MQFLIYISTTLTHTDYSYLLKYNLKTYWRLLSKYNLLTNYESTWPWINSQTKSAHNSYTNGIIYTTKSRIIERRTHEKIGRFRWIYSGRTEGYVGRQKDEQTERQTENRLTGRQMDRQTYRLTVISTNRKIDRQTYLQTGRLTGRLTDGLTDRQINKYTWRETNERTDRRTDRQTT